MLLLKNPPPGFFSGSFSFFFFLFFFVDEDSPLFSNDSLSKPSAVKYSGWFRCSNLLWVFHNREANPGIKACPVFHQLLNMGKL